MTNERQASLPTLDQMRSRLRAGMPRAEFFSTLDAMADADGLRVGGSPDCVRIPVAEGDELLCFLYDGALQYVEYRGGVFMEVESM